MRGALLRKLLQAYANGDEQAFETAALQLASNENEAGHKRLADELRTIISKMAPRVQQQRKVIDFAEPREELAGLLQGGFCHEKLKDIILSEYMKERLQRVIQENKNRSNLESWGVGASRKLLLYGPPGCGKTLAAKVLAGEIGLPLLTLRLDGLFSRFLGATAGQLKVIFDEMIHRPGVYLFDEFDALGRARSELQDIGEIRRVVTSFLQQMDADHSHSLIIAATNCGNSLDKALLRRFDLHVHFPLPTKEQIESLIRLRLVAFDISERTIKSCAKMSEGMNFADVSRACDEAIKTMALDNRRVLKAADLTDAFGNLNDRLIHTDS